MLTAALGPQSFVYPALARQVLQDYGVHRGRCLDAGCGPGLLGIELVLRSSLRVTSLDRSPAMLAHCRRLSRERGVEDRVTLTLADVHQLPFPDGAFDLVVSRGSIIFWDDPARALVELGRVLAPGGALLVGGGSGRLWPRDLGGVLKKLRFIAAHAVRRRVKASWKARMRSRAEWREIVAVSGLPGARLLDHQLWIECRKPSAPLESP